LKNRKATAATLSRADLARMICETEGLLKPRVRNPSDRQNAAVVSDAWKHLLDYEREVHGFKKPKNRFLPYSLGIAAALTILLAGGLLFSFLAGNRSQMQPISTSAVVLFKVGSLQVAGREINVGEILKDQEVINVGSQSMADIQITSTKSSITLRVR